MPLIPIVDGENLFPRRKRAGRAAAGGNINFPSLITSDAERRGSKHKCIPYLADMDGSRGTLRDGNRIGNVRFPLPFPSKLPLALRIVRSESRHINITRQALLFAAERVGIALLSHEAVSEGDAAKAGQRA